MTRQKRLSRRPDALHPLGGENGRPIFREVAAVAAAGLLAVAGAAGCATTKPQPPGDLKHGTSVAIECINVGEGPDNWSYMPLARASGGDCF
jgi:hypothetical protein